MNLHPSVLTEATNLNQGPILLFDLNVIEGNLQKFQGIMKEGKGKLGIAVKAFSHQEVMKVASEYVDGFDISNIQEFYKIRPALRPNHEIWLTNCNLSRELDLFLENVSAEKLFVTLNDQHDLTFIKNKKTNFMIRVSYNGDSRFGFAQPDIVAMKDSLLSDPYFKGFHFHQGLEDNHVEILKKHLKSFKYYFKDFFSRGLRFNLGGSLQKFTSEELVSSINFINEYFEVLIEPGRAIANNSGFALAPIEKYVFEAGNLRVFTRLSFTSHLKWSRSVYEGIHNLDNNTEKFRIRDLVVEGPSCYEFDRSIIKARLELLPISKKSVVIFSGISGYSSEWNTTFNGIDSCSIRFIPRN